MISIDKSFYINDSGGLDIELSLDIGDNVFNSELLNDAMPGLIEDVIVEAGSYWETLAGTTLNTTRDAYMRAIDVEGGSPPRLVLRGDTSLPHMIEEGCPPFDMKPGLLRYPNRPGGSKVVPMAKPDARGSRFRTVSPHSAPDSWWHPGFVGVRLLDAVSEKIAEEIFPDKLSDLIDDLYG